MRLPWPDWHAFVLLAALVLILTLYALAAAAHFPAEHRRSESKGASGAAVLWGTLALAATSACLALSYALSALPGYAAVLASGTAILAAPLILKPLPDWFLDGRGALLVFSLAAAALALVAIAS